MREIALSEVCEVIAGQSPPSSSYNSDGDGVPFFQGKADFGVLYPTVRYWCTEPKKMTNPDDILFSVRAPVGPTNINNIKACIGRGLAAIRCGEKIDLKFLLHYLRANEEKIANLGTGSTFSAITIGTLKSLKIPLPPLATQKKIAAILDAADEHRQKTKQLLAKCDELAQSIFLEMFGDPVTNPKGWKVKSFLEFARFDTRMTKDFEKYSEFPHIGVANIEKETGKLSDYRLVKDEGLESGKYLFGPEHIIYSKIRPNLNKVSLPTFHGVCSADAYPILALKSFSTREFLAYQLRSKRFLDHILQHSSRTNIPKANKKQIEEFKGICPPFDLQLEFSLRISNIDQQKKILESEIKISEDLFNSLSKKAFKGELVN